MTASFTLPLQCTQLSELADMKETVIRLQEGSVMIADLHMTSDGEKAVHTVSEEIHLC